MNSALIPLATASHKVLPNSILLTLEEEILFVNDSKKYHIFFHKNINDKIVCEIGQNMKIYELLFEYINNTNSEFYLNLLHGDKGTKKNILDIICLVSLKEKLISAKSLEIFQVVLPSKLETDNALNCRENLDRKTLFPFK